MPSSNVISTLYESRLKRMLVVHIDSLRGTELVGFSRSGAETFRSSAPDGGSFGYLTLHPKQGALVVVTYLEPRDGWSDWHFRIGERGELTRFSPAY